MSTKLLVTKEQLAQFIGGQLEIMEYDEGGLTKRRGEIVHVTMEGEWIRIKTRWMALLTQCDDVDRWVLDLKNEYSLHYPETTIEVKDHKLILSTHDVRTVTLHDPNHDPEKLELLRVYQTVHSS